jgi:hypothetical protein
MKGGHIRRQLSQHEWVAAAWVATVLILACWTSRQMTVLLGTEAQLSATEAVPSREPADPDADGVPHDACSRPNLSRSIRGCHSVKDRQAGGHAERTAAPRSKITATSTVMPRQSSDPPTKLPAIGTAWLMSRVTATWIRLAPLTVPFVGS